jgi:multidrug resistance efflux pump
MRPLLMATEGLPGESCEALFTIDEMSNEAGQERLQNAVAESKVELKFELESSHGDMAMQVWLARPELFAATHNAQRLRRLSAFFAGSAAWQAWLGSSLALPT